MAKKAGRPKATPKRVTVTLAQHHAAELQTLADEAGVTLSALCAHVLERYAIQDREVMTNDVIAQRLEQTLQSYFRQFDERFSRLFMRQLHEAVAIRSQMVTLAKEEYGPERGLKLQEVCWKSATNAINPHLQRTAIEDYDGIDHLTAPTTREERQLIDQQRQLAAQQATQMQYPQQPTQTHYTPNTDETERQ